MEREIMDGCFRTDSPEEAGISAETSVPSPGSFGSGGDLKAAHQYSSASCSSPKRSRRSIQKKVVTIPIAEADGSRPRSTGEGAPPSDSWAWRKYGQKPIKGSPYPRGYYRCSSSKGCPARKQVERSSIDPTMLVVTYSSDHNHSWPLPKPHHRSAIVNISVPSPSPSFEEEEAIPVVAPTPEPADDKFSDIPTIGIRDEYFWFSDVASPSAASTESTDDLLLGSIFVSAEVAAMSFGGECEELEREEEEEEEGSLFAGLGELPEWSVVFRRGFLDGRRCGVAASL